MLPTQLFNRDTAKQLLKNHFTLSEIDNINVSNLTVVQAALA